MKIIDDKGNEINSNFPQKRVDYYLIRVGAKNLNELNFEQRKKLFLLSIKDFLEGTLYLEEMSSLAMELWKYPSEISNPDENELNDAIQASSELTFYIRKIPEVEEKTGNFISFMTEIKNYYNKHFPF